MQPLSRPSDSWKTVEQYEQKGSYTSAFWRTVPFDKLERLAARLRSNPKLKCQANREKYAQGHEAVVIELQFSDREIWIARLRAPVDVCGETPTPAKLARQTECDVATLRLVRERTTIPVPTVYAYSSTSDNELGMPYVLMSAIVGFPPEYFGFDYLPRVKPDDMPLLDRYVESLADCYLQLSAITFDRIGSVYFDPADNSKYVIGPLAESGLGPFDTAWEFYSAGAEDMEQRFLSLPHDTPEERGDRALVLWLYRLGLGLLANSPNNRGPFLLCHNDFGMHNTLIDKVCRRFNVLHPLWHSHSRRIQEGNVAGFFDWQNAAAYPAEPFATQPFGLTDNPARSESASLAHLHRAFSSALARLEDSGKYPQVKRRLSELHSSPLAYLVGRLFVLMAGPDQCGEPYGAMLARFVLGVDDAAPFKNSVLFREWYADTMRRVESRRPR